MSTSDIPRFRFAPSPTGSPHVGSLHTALFCWALARGMGGDFILRVDDTDPARNTPQAADEMLDALQWLGLDWDEGPRVGGPHEPYVQSQRRRRHEEVAAQLVQRQAAYYGDNPQADLGQDAGAPLRLRLPSTGQTVVDDALRGAVTFDYESLQDPVIVRSDGSPLYHLAAVVDDHDMAISHVVRGEEWLASTPIHIHLYRALEWSPPAWIHLPLIHNERGEKLSKREARGGYLVRDFQDAGYLPQALFNYLLLLGWSPDGSEEIVSKWDVRRQFRLERLSASPATFDWEKLNWVNRQYLKRESNARLAALIRPYLEDVYDMSGVGEQWLEQLTGLIRDDMRRLSDAVDLAQWGLSESFAVSREAKAALQGEEARAVLVHTVAELAHVVLLDRQTAHSILQGLQQQFAESQGLQAKDVYWPIRAALTGSTRGPALPEIMALLGKGRCLERIAAILRSE